jgi:hypothetical protein
MMLMVAPMPPGGVSARLDLYTWIDGRGRHLAAVEQHHVQVGADAAHGHARTFAQVAVDRHAGNTLQRFGQVGVGEFTDVFSDDAVDETVGVALEVHGRLHGGADAGHDDLLWGIGGGAGGLRECCWREGRASAGDGKGDQPLVGIRLNGNIFLMITHCFSSLAIVP